MPLIDSLISLVLVLAVIGLILYLINRFIPMEAGVKDLMNTVVKIILVVVLILWLLGLLGYGPVRGPFILRN